MGDIGASDLANSVTAFATILSGVIALLFTAFIAKQPWRWIAVYMAIFVTGMATVWYHGYGETHIAGLADGGTNLLLAWLIQVAVLWDYYSGKFRWIAAVVSGALNLLVVAWRAVVGLDFTSFYIVSFNAFGGFHPMEIMLILDSILAVALIYGKFPRIPVESRALLYMFTGFFFIGALLAAASNQRIDFHILCYHSLWHIVGAFGFVALWAFNHMRFADT